MQFRTDPKAAAALIPEPYTLKEPIVTVLFSWFDYPYIHQAENEYGLSAICLNARFDGERDHKDGLYNLIMPETQNWPTLMGRDCSGTGKIFADIPFPYQIQNKHTITEVRSFNTGPRKREWTTFYGVDFGPMTRCDDAEMKQWENAINALPIFVYRVISEEARGGLLLNYPSHYGFVRELNECWQGKDAELFFGEDINLYLESRAMKALKTLPVLEVLGAAHYHAVVRSDRTQGGKLV
jgi:acetoacetate decarboxylase